MDRPAASSPNPPDPPDPLRSVHTTTLGDLLRQAGASLLISTYQAGKLIIARAESPECGGAVNTHFRNFDTPMGLAYAGGRLAIGAKLHVHEFHNQPDVARTLPPTGSHDACFLPRHSVVTGQIGIHDIAWANPTSDASTNSVDPELWIVNTRFSCLCTRDPRYSFVPRWRPPFITSLAPEDRCHLNGLATRDGQPRYVTALGETDTPAGWREHKSAGGCLIDIATNQILARHLSMPHSPRWHDHRLWLLESGQGSLATVNESTGQLQPLTHLPGFTRGLDFLGPYAFVGLSQVRAHNAVFGNLPLTTRLSPEDRRCGVWVVDTRKGNTVAFLQFESGVQEIFAVQVLPMSWPDLLTDDQPAVSETFLLPDDALNDVARP